MEVVLIARNPGGGDGAPSTIDYRVEIVLHSLVAPSSAQSRVITQLPPSSWPGASSTSPEQSEATDHANKRHALAGFSELGSGEPNEFATFVQGQERFRANQDLREELEDDFRLFAERVDQNEGFMVTTPISDGFGGFSSALLEALREDYSKKTIFTTATLADAASWKRGDSERSRAQRMLNTALSLQNLEDISSMVLPIQPPASWPPDTPWATYLREDLPKLDTYSQILTMHLQSANTELREAESLTSIVQQLNWRGDNKIAHLSGASPLLPPDLLKNDAGLTRLEKSIFDFSRWQDPSKDAVGHILDRAAQKHSIIRGYDREELQELGAILEKYTLLKEPLAQWIAEPAPFPVIPSLSPIFRSLTPNGRPLNIAPPEHPEPFSRAGLFGLPNPFYPPSLEKSYFVQPDSIPLLTTLSTTSASRHLLRHLSSSIKELQRVRAGVLVEYEDGEYGLGREGVMECRERLETLADGLASTGGVESGDDEPDRDEDENFEVDGESDIDL